MICGLHSFPIGQYWSMSSKNSEGEGTWDGLELASNVRNWMGPETLKTWCIFWGDKYLLVTCPKNN